MPDLSMDFFDRFRPTADLLVVWLDPGKQITKGGIILPPDAQQIRQHGNVLSTGPDVTLVAKGQKVLLPIHCGTDLGSMKNTPVLLVHEKDLLAVLESSDLDDTDDLA